MINNLLLSGASSSLYSGGLHASVKEFSAKIERTPSKNTMHHHWDISVAHRTLCTASPLGIIGRDKSQKSLSAAATLARPLLFRREGGSHCRPSTKSIRNTSWL
jgi:hypothetical protein